MKIFIRVFILSVGLFCVYGALIQPSLSMASDDESIDYLDDEFYEDTGSDQVEVGDPLEPFNRAMFHVNDFSYTWIFNPVATGYSYVVPSDLRGAFDNFIQNLKEPVNFINSLLQGRFTDAGTAVLRFVINSVAGVGGLGDPAGREMGFARAEAQFGQTLAVWGIGDGFYLVVPFYGATTLRDFGADLVDGLITPYYFWVDGWDAAAGIYTGKELNNLSLHLGEYEDLKAMSLDPYIAIRNGYFQYRKRMRNLDPAYEGHD